MSVCVLAQLYGVTCVSVRMCMYVHGSVCAVMCHCKIQLTLFSVSAVVCVCDSLLGVCGSVTCLACCRISHVVFVFTRSL